MWDIVLLAGGIALLGLAWTLAQRRREREVMDRLERAGRDPAAVLGELDAAIREDRKREEFWKRQNPGR